MVNALIDATRTKRIDLGLPVRGLDQLRVSPDTFTVLAEEKPSNQSWPDFATEAMVVFAVTKRMVAFDTQAANRLVVRLGLASPEPSVAQSGQPDGRQKRPLAKAPSR